MDEIKYVNLDVIYPYVWWGTEVSAHVSFHLAMGDFGKVLTEPVHQFAFSLAYILQAASGALETVNKVETLARHGMPDP